MSKLLTIGSMAFDAIETPFGKVEKTMGGAANYIGLSASFFNINQAIVSVVGEDYPSEYLQILQEKNIDISQVEIQKNGKTFFWSGKYHTDMNMRDTLQTQLNVLAEFRPKIPQNFTDASFVMLGNLHPQIQLDVLAQLTQKPRLVVLDTMGFWMNNAWETLLEVIKKIDVITINDEEARQLSGEYSLVKAAKKIMEMGSAYVIIKKGEHGAMLFHKNEIFYAPAMPLEEVFDPTGAGDSFAGGFIGFLTKIENISFEDMKKALVYGANIASFTVERFGTERLLNLSENEVSNRFKMFEKLTRF